MESIQIEMMMVSQPGSIWQDTGMASQNHVQLLALFSIIDHVWNKIDKITRQETEMIMESNVQDEIEVFPCTIITSRS